MTLSDHAGVPKLTPNWDRARCSRCTAPAFSLFRSSADNKEISNSSLRLGITG